MGCGAAPGLCFVVINPCVLSANRVDFGFFLLPPPPAGERSAATNEWSDGLLASVFKNAAEGLCAGEHSALPLQAHRRNGSS